MVEALQLQLKTAYQVREVMPEADVDLQQENIKLQQEIIDLKQKNILLQQEVNNVKQDHVVMEHRLARLFNNTYMIRTQQQSSAHSGQVLLLFGSIVALVLLLFYGMGFIDFSLPSTVDYDPLVVERLR